MKGSPAVIKISNHKILKLINFQISNNLNEGLKKTINWYSDLVNYTRL